MGKHPLDRMEMLERILSKMFVDENGCWIWYGTVDKESGYGQINWQGKTRKLHRFVASCFFPNLTDNKEIQIRHTCDVRNCINFMHFKLGDKSDNFQDSVSRGRWHGGFGKHFKNDLKEKDWIFAKTRQFAKLRDTDPEYYSKIKHGFVW